MNDLAANRTGYITAPPPHRYIFRTNPICENVVFKLKMSKKYDFLLKNWTQNLKTGKLCSFEEKIIREYKKTSYFSTPHRNTEIRHFTKTFDQIQI